MKFFRPFRPLFRTVIAGLYVFLLVLLPYGHMQLHGLGEDDGCGHHHCCGKPNDDSSSQDDDSGTTCPLCDLAQLAFTAPPVFAAPVLVIRFTIPAEAGEELYGAEIKYTPRARAPPFMTA